MPKVNTTSLREELEHLRSEFKSLSSAGKVSQESAVLIRGLLVIVDMLVAIFMEKSTKKNNKNSSKPSSQTDKDESAKTTTGSKERGRGDNGQRTSSTRTVETTQIAKADHCDVCGENLKKVPCLEHERRTKIDIVFEKTVVHVDAEIKTCPCCDSTVKGEFPKDMSGPIQYGIGLKAYLINLVVSQMVALSRAQKMVTALIGRTISESSILKYIMQLYNALEAWEQSGIEALMSSKTLHSDETSIRVIKRNYWIHVYSSRELTLKFLHPKRGKEAVDDIGIIPRYGGVVIHDCWSTYFGFVNCKHALCGSHLLRELVFVIESNGYNWARNMKKLLQEMCKEVSLRKDKKLTPAEYGNLQKRYRNILTRGEKELPPIPLRRKGQRGRIAKSDAHNLWERLKEHEEKVILFAKLAEVPFTNNRAERDLRMAKVKQKVSGCFRSEVFAKAYCRISSYLITMANRGYNPLIAIEMALAGNAPLENSQ